MNSVAELKIRLQSLGVRLPQIEKGRRGGAGPAAGKSLIFGNTVANVPTWGWFTEGTPFHIAKEGDDFWIFEGDQKIIKVRFPKTPDFYSKNTTDGVSMKKVALLHGVSCLASTVCQRCIYYGTPKACSFCGIGLSLKLGDTIEEKTPQQLAEVAAAAKEEGAVNHVTLTSGTLRGKNKGVERQLMAAKAIKEAAGLPVHVQMEPLSDMSIIEEMPSWGVDTLGIHIESLDDKILEKHTPIKARLGFDSFMRNWEKALDVLGKNQVDTFIIAGLGEDINKTLDRIKIIAELGVYPFIVPLRPIPGTPLEKERPPSKGHMLALLESAAEIVRDAGLDWKKSKAGCLRCRACSPLPDVVDGL